MYVLNIHRRRISASKTELWNLLLTLSSARDKVWPYEQWPRMRLDKGLKQGSTGGHGPIKYKVEKINSPNSIQFRFIKPKGFNGLHIFELKEIDDKTTEIKHIIDIRTKGLDTLLWIFAIRYLHDALIEDSLDKVENHFVSIKKKSKWNVWVRLLRVIFSKRKKQENHIVKFVLHARFGRYNGERSFLST